MHGLSWKFAGSNVLFSPTGEVLIEEGGESESRGTWRAEIRDGEPRRNLWQWTVDGEARPALPVRYRFNELNQLEVTIPAISLDGDDSAPTPFNGQIRIDDSHDVVYDLFGADGQPTGHHAVVYGELRISADSRSMMVDLVEGGAAEIEGEQGNRSLEARRNNLEQFRGDDLLRFRAVTLNEIEGGDELVPAEALLDFFGNWEIQGPQLTFMSKVQGDLTKPDVVLGLSGRFRAITAGIAYFAGPEGSQATLNVAGRHTWNSAEARWNLAVGFSAKSYRATLDGKVEKKFAGGRELTISGKATVEQAAGQGVEIDLQLDAAYDWSEDGKLVFRAQVAGGAGPAGDLSYDLQLEGNFRFKAGTLSFMVKLDSSGPKPSTALALSFQANPTDLIRSLSLVLNVDKDQVNVDFEFEVQLTFADGRLVKSPPQALAA